MILWRQNYACRNKHVSVPRKIRETLLKLGSELFTKSLNCQNECCLRRTTNRKKERKKVSRICRDKYLPQQKFCCDKCIFCHKYHFCLDKSFVATNMCLVLQNTYLSRQVPPMIAENSPQLQNASDRRNVNVEIIMTTSVVAFAVGCFLPQTVSKLNLTRDSLS